MSSLTMVVLIPTYNEAPNIQRQLRSLSTLRASRGQGQRFDLLVIDDQSPDGTASLVRELDLPWVSVITPQEKNGLGNAYKHGFRWALERGYSHVIEMDGDGSHRVEDLHQLLDAEPEIDLVIGSRWIPGGAIENWSWSRRVISRSGNLYARTLLRLPIKDSTSGFRRISATVLAQIDLAEIDSAGYGFQIEMAYAIYKHGGKVLEVPICFIERIAGYSKMSTAIAIEAFYNITRRAIGK